MNTEIRNFISYQEPKKHILLFIKLNCGPTFSVHNPVGVKLLVRLRLGFSYLHEQKFRYNFMILWILYALADLWQIETLTARQPEPTSHCLLCCPNLFSFHSALLNDLDLIDYYFSVQWNRSGKCTLIQQFED